jgi:hypothetical protein
LVKGKPVAGVTDVMPGNTHRVIADGALPAIVPLRTFSVEIEDGEGVRRSLK